MTTFLVKTENGNDTVYFEVQYNEDHHNNYVNSVISDHALTQEFVAKGYSFPSVVASYEVSIQEDYAKAYDQLTRAEKHKKGFPAQYYDALKKTKQLMEAISIVESDMFVIG